MPLRLEIKSFHRMSPTQEAWKTLDGDPFSIGRDPGNGWVLPDPEMVVSGRHCFIEQAASRYYLTDISRNGTYMNDAEEPIGQYNRIEIQDGDRFRAGSYIIEAKLVMEPPAVETARSATPIDPPKILPDEHGSMADIIKVIAPRRSGSGVLPPEDMSSLSLSSDPVPARPEEHAILDSVLRDLERGLSPADARRGGNAANSAQPPDPPPSNPGTTQQMPVGSVTQPAAATDGAARNVAAGLAELLAGAGCPDLHFDRTTPEEVLRLAGSLLREAVQGVIETLATRALIRSEFRARPTLGGPSGNNLLKFSTDAGEALAKLLQGPGKSHATPVASMRGAFDDIRAHELAMLAALQATLRTMLDRLDPERIALEIGEAGGLANLAGGRRARCWEEYRRRHEALSRELKDEFHRGLGRDFVKAYEAHALRRDRPPG